MSHGFTLYDSFFSLEHSYAIQELKQVGAWWIGSDIHLEKSVVVPPHHAVKDATILLNKKHLPPMRLTYGGLVSLGWSVRSFMAQSGIEPRFIPQEIPPESLLDLRNGKTVPIPITVINWGERPVEISGAFMRFYWAYDSMRLRGNKLREIVGNELIIKGLEGVDWDFAKMTDDPEIAELLKLPSKYDDVCSIRLPLSDTKLYIPGDETPLSIKSRAELYTMQYPIPKNLSLYFTIGETTHVELSENIIGVIEMTGYDTGRHIRSPLIDPKFAGKIRTEITGPINYIELNIYRK